MNRNFIIALLGVALFMGSPSFAAVQEYTAADGVTPVKVSALKPLPTIASGTTTVSLGTIGSTTNPLSVKFVGQTVSSMTVHLDTGSSSTPITVIATAPTGYLDISGPTFSIPAGTKVDIGGKTPANFQGFRVRVYGDDVVFGPSLTLATGTFCVGDVVASGSVFSWDGPGDGDIWCATKNGGAATATMWAW